MATDSPPTKPSTEPPAKPPAKPPAEPSTQPPAIPSAEPPTTSSASPPKRTGFWTLQNVTALLALLAFTSNIATFTDLERHWIPNAGKSQAELQQEGEQAAAAQTRKWYVDTSNDACERAGAAAHVPTEPASITYSWMMQVLSARRTVLRFWGDVPGDLSSAADRASSEKMLSDFAAANAAWLTMAQDLKARNVAGYNMGLSLYLGSEGSFFAEASTYGLASCSQQWPSPPLWE